MMDTIPRNSTGWPVIGPELMTYSQLLAEAKGWRNSVPGTVGGAEWKKYTGELYRRGFMTAVELQEGILPDEVPGGAAQERHRRWSQGQSGMR